MSIILEDIQKAAPKILFGVIVDESAPGGTRFISNLPPRETIINLQGLALQLMQSFSEQSSLIVPNQKMVFKNPEGGANGNSK